MFYNWEVRKLDINNAFLNGFLEENVYVKQSEGFEDPRKSTYICKLSKALYGLKQSPRVWFGRPRQCLINWDFKNSKSDSSLFFYKGNDLFLVILVHVDDIFVTANNYVALKEFMQRLNSILS